MTTDATAKPRDAGSLLKVAALAGLAAPIVYAFGVAVGGFVTPAYSHLANMISELTMAGAPARVPLAAVTISFSRVSPSRFRGPIPGPRYEGVVVGAVLLVTIAIAGIAMSVFFPTDRPTEPLTPIGWAHVGFAAIASLGTMAAVFSFAWALRPVRYWRTFSTFSLAALAAIAVSGIWTATTTTQLSPLMGLTERVTIGAFMVWLFVFALALLRYDGRRHQSTAAVVNG